ncbi:helix-turn-helix domain-containing protein [Palleronia sp. KMU-117]|uniref:helix-turn-helix domain-containing protein n=1 Tax=Palleronia sp. KMU-117 TaxID=3434108 RepID=UPI003D722362
MLKTFIGPRLRRLRLEHGETQAQMARALGISTSYVNLLEKNERSVSVPVMLKLFEAYGVDWRDIAEDDDTSTLADLRAALQDPLFEVQRPDLTQLRAAQIHSPDLVSSFLKLHRAFLAATDQLLSLAGAGEAREVLQSSPEATVHNFFRRNRNHFEALEAAAGRFWEGERVPTDDAYARVKARLLDKLGLRVRLVTVAEMPDTLRQYDEARREVLLSEALDHPNRLFQLVHVAGLIEQRAVLDDLLAQSGIDDPHGLARCRVELANYFAAAVLMPYGPFLAEALASKYDFDHLATRFGVSFEQACHRATTLQRSGAQGVPFFFLRIDKAGNVTKRFNATDFHLAEYGGACPRLEVHSSFRTPGRIVPQFVEMPDASQFFVFARTVDRPSFTRHSQDMRLAVAMGCGVEHVGQIGYAEDLRLSDARTTPIGINCRVCPRMSCDQRAHQAAVISEPLDERRRGATRYAS